LAIPLTGRPGSAGTLVTKTLLIAGESDFGPTPLRPPRDAARL
jgi:hypothetical protein